MKSSGKLLTQDHVHIAYEHNQNNRELVVIVCPGFFNSKKNRWMQKTAQLLEELYDTVLFDFRGHGESGGKFCWSAREHLDLDAVLNYVQSHGYRQVGILGFSLGAAATVNLLGQRRGVQSAVLISCPASFWGIEYHFWRPEMFSDLQDNMECDWEGKGARTGFLFLPKLKPLQQVAKIQGTKLFFIHGEKDWIIHDRHSKQLFAAASEPKKIEIVPGGLHAERLIQQDQARMKELFLGWFEKTLV